MPDPRTEGRRGALRWLIGGFMSLWAVAAAGAAALFLKAPDGEKRPGEGLVRCGPLATLDVGSARFIRHGAEPLVVVRTSDSEVLALSAVCTHLRCVLHWDDATRTILCPCHAGSFDRSGNVLSGPPTRPLPQHRVEIRAGEIVVHT